VLDRPAIHHAGAGRRCYSAPNDATSDGVRYT